MSPPLVSFVMAVHNGMPYLPKAMDSIMRQSFQDFEAIVVDDHSTDCSDDWCRRVRDPRVRILEHSGKGQTEALNAGLRAARGEWIARMDADDWSYPERIEEQIAAVTDTSVMISADYWLCDEDLETVAYIGLSNPSKRLYQYMRTRNNPLCHPVMMFRRQVALDAGGYDTSLRNAQDYDLWLRLLERGELVHVTRSLLKYRVVRTSLSVADQNQQELERRRSLGQSSTATPMSAVTKAEREGLYRYKLGFGSWINGSRRRAWADLFSAACTHRRLRLRATILGLLLLVPRRWRLWLGGYRGVYR